MNAFISPPRQAGVVLVLRTACGAMALAVGLLGTVPARAQEDATLSAITLANAKPGSIYTLRLSTAFDAETETYTASAINKIARVTLTPTATQSSASITVAVGEAAAAASPAARPARPATFPRAVA